MRERIRDAKRVVVKLGSNRIKSRRITRHDYALYARPIRRDGLLRQRIVAEPKAITIVRVGYCSGKQENREGKAGFPAGAELS